MFLKVTAPVPQEVRLKARLGCFAAVLEKEDFAITEEEGKKLLICETAVRHLQASLKPWSYDAAVEARSSAQANYKACPSPENEAALVLVSDPQKLKVHYSRVSREISAAGTDYTSKNIVPLVIPILTRALAVVQSHLEELMDYERRQRAEYDLDATFLVIDVRGIPSQTVPYSPIVKALETEIKNQTVRLEDMKKGIMNYGPTSPSSFLRGIVHFFEE